jgi:hypothetical protein
VVRVSRGVRYLIVLICGGAYRAGGAVLPHAYGVTYGACGSGRGAALFANPICSADDMYDVLGTLVIPLLRSDECT